MARLLVVALGLLLLAGCDGIQVEPVDVKGQPIVGRWYYAGEQVQDGEKQSIHSYLHVRNDGLATYAYQVCRSDLAGGGHNHSQLILEEMPIKRLNTKKMVLQKFPLTPSFQLTLGQWPDQGDGSFNVDEVSLQPIEEAQTPDFRNWTCS